MAPQELDRTALAEIAGDHLLNLKQIQDLTGLSDEVCSRWLKETGVCIRLHRRLYALESSVLAALKKSEGAN